MPSICKNPSCSRRHNPLLRCDHPSVLSLPREGPPIQPKPTQPLPPLPKTTPCPECLKLQTHISELEELLATKQEPNQVANKHGKYADSEKRRTYQRELMRKRRAAKSSKS